MKLFSPFLRLAAAPIAALALAGCGDDMPFQPDMPDLPDTPEMPGTNGPVRWHVELTGLGMRSIWGTSEDALWVPGGDGFVTRRDGDSWIAVPTGIDGSIRGLWGTADDDVYGLLDSSIVHFDGTTWSIVHHAPATLSDIWGSSANDVYAVGIAGTVVHFDGTSWTSVDVDVDWYLSHVDGTAANNVYVIGRVNGNRDGILKFNGSSWTTQRLISASETLSLAVTPSGNSLVGESGSYVYGGSSELFLLSEPAVTIAALGADVLGADGDGRAFHWRHPDTEWTTFPSPIRNVWSAPWGKVYGVGTEGQIVSHDGVAWSTVREARPATQFNAIFGAPDGATFVVGGDAYVRDGDAWRPSPLANASASAAGWAVSRDFAMAVGRGGAIDHWNGNAWVSAPSSTSANLTSVWASGPADAFAVAFDGTVLHYDGAAWSPTTQLGGQLVDVHGTSGDDVFACASTRRVFHFDGAGWTDMPLPEIGLLNAIWAVSPTNVLAAGRDGLVLRYDGASWTSLPSPTDEHIEDIWARGPDAVFLLTAGGAIFRFDGAQWTTHAIAPGRLARSIWGTEDDLLAAGFATSVMRLGT